MRSIASLRVLGLRIVTLTAFVLWFGIVAMFSIWTTGEAQGGWAILCGAIAAFIFDRMTQSALDRSSAPLLSGLFVSLVVLAAVVKFGGDWQRQGITSEHQRQSEAFERGLRGR